MAPAKPPLPPQQGESAAAYLRRQSLPFGEIPEALVVTHHEHVKRWTDATKIFWGAVTVATAIATGGFYAGVQFANLKAEFQLQMASMLTKESYEKSTDEREAKMLGRIFVRLQNEPWNFACANYATKGKDYRLCNYIGPQ